MFPSGVKVRVSGRTHCFTSILKATRSFAFVLDSQNEDIWDVGERIGAVAPTHDDGLLCAGDSGIFSFRLQSGEKKVLVDPESDKRPENRFNDGMCDPSGRFWAGTISTTKQTGDASLYMFDREGQLHKKIPHVTNSNGICWSADASLMYYIDTPDEKGYGISV